MAAFCHREPAFVRSGIWERTAQPVFRAAYRLYGEARGWQNPTVAPKTLADHLGWPKLERKITAIIRTNNG